MIELKKRDLGKSYKSCFIFKKTSLLKCCVGFWIQKMGHRQNHILLCDLVINLGTAIEGTPKTRVLYDKIISVNNWPLEAKTCPPKSSNPSCRWLEAKAKTSHFTVGTLCLEAKHTEKQQENEKSLTNARHVKRPLKPFTSDPPRLKRDFRQTQSQPLKPSGCNTHVWLPRHRKRMMRRLIGAHKSCAPATTHKHNEHWKLSTRTPWHGCRKAKSGSC